LPYPVVSDRDATIIGLYGVYDHAVGTAYPTIFLVDRQGVLRYKKKIEGLNDLVPAGDIVNRLRDTEIP
jgi:peroxiredoxin Q/BCP